MILILEELFIRCEREQIIPVPFEHLVFFSLNKIKDIPRSINSDGLRMHLYAEEVNMKTGVPSWASLFHPESSDQFPSIPVPQRIKENDNTEGNSK